MRHNRGYSPSATALFSNPRQSRIAGEHRRMMQGLTDYVAARHGMALLGDDPVVSHLASASGFGRHDLGIARMIAGNAAFTAVVVPTRISTDAQEMRSLVYVKQDAAFLGTKVILAPDRWLKAPGRASVSRVIARCRNIPVPGEDVEAVLEYLRTAGRGTVKTCASAIGGHPDPYGAVFALAAWGDVSVERTRPLGPDTAVWIPTNKTLLIGEQA